MTLAGIPWQPVRECDEADTFLRHMEAVDKKVAYALNEAHRKIQQRVNNKRKPKAPFEDGCWIWLLSPKKVGGQKIERWWKGPFQTPTHMVKNPSFPPNHGEPGGHGVRPRPS